MNNKEMFDVMAVAGKYERDGEEKLRWFKCGFAIVEQGKETRIKLNGLPVGNEWDGWLALKPQDRFANKKPLQDNNSSS